MVLLRFLMKQFASLFHIAQFCRMRHTHKKAETVQRLEVGFDESGPDTDAH